VLFRKRNKYFISRQKRLEQYYTQNKKRGLGIVFYAPIAVAKNLPKKYANSVFGRPFRKIYISYTKIFLFILLIAAFIYLLFFSSIFKIKRIIVVNNRILIEGDIIEFLKERGIENKNIFLLNTEQVKNVLIDYYKRLEEVRVYKALPSKIKIKIKEKPSTVVWETGNVRYLLDNNGFVASEVNEDLKMPIVVDFASLPINIGDRIVTRNFIEFVNIVDESLQKRFGLGVVGYSISQTTFELKAHINSGFYIVFDTLADPVEQLNKLAKVYQEGEVISEYVILSINGRVIVK